MQKIITFLLLVFPLSTWADTSNYELFSILNNQSLSAEFISNAYLLGIIESAFHEDVRLRKQKDKRQICMTDMLGTTIIEDATIQIIADKAQLYGMKHMLKQKISIPDIMRYPASITVRLGLQVIFPCKNQKLKFKFDRDVLEAMPILNLPNKKEKGPTTKDGIPLGKGPIISA